MASVESFGGLGADAAEPCPQEVTCVVLIPFSGGTELGEPVSAGQ